MMLYTFSEASHNFLAKKIFHCSPTTVINWIKKTGAEAKMTEIAEDIKKIEIDDMRHSIGSKNKKLLFFFSSDSSPLQSLLQSIDIFML